MITTKFADRGGVTTTIPPHVTGHTWAKDGTLLRVDRCGSLNRSGPQMRKSEAPRRAGHRAR
jgi:hypothetical protein